jgi:hypothetical protein
MRAFISSLLLVAIGCAGAIAERPADIAKPDIRVRQAGSIFFGSSGSAPASFEITVTNNATVALRVKEIELTSPGMMQYSIGRASKLFNEIVEPGQSKTLGMSATAYTQNTRIHSDEPLSVQAIVRLEAGGHGFREVVLEQFAGMGQ